MSRTSLITAAALLVAGVLGAAPRAAAAAGPPGSVAGSSAGAGSVGAGSPLQAAWQSVLAEPSIRHALIGGYAYDVTTGRTLASVHANWRLTPGSVTKLYATAASLADGPAKISITTRVAQARAGGPVYLVGGGDVLSARPGQPGGNTTLEQLARTVAAKLGHRAARVVGVSTLFGGWAAGPGWDVSEVGVAGDPAVSALTSDRDAVQVVVAPGASAGSKPTVSIDPGDPGMAPPGFFRIENHAVTGAAGAHGRLFVRCPPGTDAIVITGTKPLGAAPTKQGLAIGNPSLFTAALFQYYLSQDGVRLSQAATTGTLPGDARDIDTYRLPESLATYLRLQNSWSINQKAEDLYRLIGVAQQGTGTPQAAQAAITAYLTQAHLPLGRVQVDGSGLSVLDEMSASQVVGLLSYVARQSYFGTFEHSLIHIGRTSQCTFMCGFMDGTAAAGHVWLKTGNLANQWNYAGYAHAKNGDLIAFALLFDGLQGDNAFNQAIHPIDAMTVDVASWPDEPQGGAGATAGSAGGGLPAGVVAALPAGVADAVRGAYTPGDVVSASVVNVGTGRVVAQANGQTELQGGLLPRLATVAAALKQTASPGAPGVQATGQVTGGSVHGNLVLNGRYDPLFSYQQLTGLARSLARRGIRSVTGRLEFVAGDGGPFGPQQDDVADLPFPTPYEDVGASFSPPAGPLAVNQDHVGIVVRGADAPGKPAQVSVEPLGSPVGVTGTIATGGTASAPSAVWQPGMQAYRLSGAVAPGERVTLMVAPPYPGLVAADWLLTALRAAGITVHGAPVSVAADPGGQTLASIPAPTVAAEAQQALSSPSNVAPFDLYRLLGTHPAASLAALIGSYDQILDPSGNAADDFLTADSISAMLAVVHSSAAEAPLISVLSLPWVVRQPERTTLAGYAPGPGGQLFAYTVIINGQLYNATPDLPSRFQPMISRSK
jgi:D-alanyl-D-alanine carboxypeptidase/D-alanyl-D-alanine-endopeptidase (penicillin-binding protein 4)